MSTVSISALRVFIMVILNAQSDNSKTSKVMSKSSSDVLSLQTAPFFPFKTPCYFMLKVAMMYWVKGVQYRLQCSFLLREAVILRITILGAGVFPVDRRRVVDFQFASFFLVVRRGVTTS